jgi:hypothetical protein
VHIVAEDPEKVAARAHDTLVAAGLKAEDIRAIEPALEDVFISVLGAKHG